MNYHTPRLIRMFSVAAATILLGASTAVAGTIGYWRFDDGTAGATAGMLVTQSNSPTFDGTAQGNAGGALPRFSSEVPDAFIFAGPGGAMIGVDNASLEFVNGGLPSNPDSHTGGRVSISGGDPLMQPRDFTIEAFIKIDGHVNWPTIVAKSRADAGGCSFLLDTNNNGHLRARIDSQPLGSGGGVAGFNQGIFSNADGFVEDGMWHHVAATYLDSTRQLTLFVDYEQVGQGTILNPIVYDGNPFLIGQGGGGRAFDGWIDEVRFSDTVLTTDQFLFASVPEPSGLVLFGLGLALLLGRGQGRTGRRRVT